MPPIRRRRRTLAPLLLLAAAAVAACNGAGQRPTAGPATPAAAESPASAAPTQLTVRGVRGHYDLGDYSITGDVVNGHHEPIHNVELEVVYRGAGGEELAREDAAVVLTRVAPGGTAPFIDTRHAAPEGITAHEVTVTRIARGGGNRPLAITGVQTRAGITGAIVTGQAHNDIGVPLIAIKLVTTSRNAAGEVTGVHFDHPVTRTLAAGAAVDFTVETMDDTGAADRVTVQGEGQARQ